MNSQQEVATMRLVGASNWFIRGPFLLKTIFLGIFVVIIIDLILFAGIVLSGQSLINWFFDFDRISVAADVVGVYCFGWRVPDAAGTYVVEVSLAPPQLTAYDVVWLQVT